MRVPLLIAVSIVVSVAATSAHIVRSLQHPNEATAFVGSPSASTDLPISIEWSGTTTGLRVACMVVANTSPPRTDDPARPRLTAVGFELPGEPSGFTLLSPKGEGWDLHEQVPVHVPGHGTMTVDLALVLPVNPMGHGIWGPRGRYPGIPPGQQPNRLNGTRFCLAGPFPNDPATGLPLSIEKIIDGVVVRFHGVEGRGPSIDLGVWHNPGPRIIPLYP